MQTVITPPRWDLSPIFPSLDSPEFRAGFDRLVAGIDSLDKQFPEGVTPETSQFETRLRAYIDLLEQSNRLGAYVYFLVSTDSFDDAAQARQSELQRATSRLSKIGTRFTAWIGTLEIEQLIASSQFAAEHDYWLRKAKEESRHLMNPGEEALAADLRLSGSVGWNKLHGNLSSQIEVTVQGRPLAMSEVRNLAYETDPEARRAAYEAELEAWKRNETPLAASLNGVKGEKGTLTERRGWQSPLDEALFKANIDRETLDAMMMAAHESFPDFRRYLRAKARMLGKERLPWYDLFAPVADDPREWTYDEAADFVATKFDGYSSVLGNFARRTYRESWIDAEPRAGKRDGAYCYGVEQDVSRVMMNFKPSFGSVSTLAHELGHGYHNVCLADKTVLQRTTPMTLAETASIFCETIIKQAAQRQGSEGEQVAILEASLQGSCQVVVDITSRFLFEQAVFEGRRKRDLAPREFCDLMLDAQRQTYGDGLDEDFLHPYMWAVKPHYYSSSFYNFPYMFGLLFGLEVYAEYVRNPNGFHARYDDLLASTGLADAATLAQRFGIDIRKPDFWRASLDQIRGDIDRFEALAAATRQ